MLTNISQRKIDSIDRLSTICVHERRKIGRPLNEHNGEA